MAKTISLRFHQHADCCAQDVLDNMIELSVENGGDSINDNYAVIKTERWAMDNGDELRALAKKVDAMLKESKAL